MVRLLMLQTFIAARWALLGSLVAFLSACEGESRATNEETPGAEEGAADYATQGPFFVAEGAPAPQACSAAADCVANTLPDTRNPCCHNPDTLEAYSVAYRDWVTAWRLEQCVGIVCPPPPLPPHPDDCRFEPRCVEGSCADSCADSGD